MKFDSLSRVMALCAVIWGVPVAAILLTLDYAKGTLDASLALSVIVTTLVGGAIVGAALWYAIGRYLVTARRLQKERKKQEQGSGNRNKGDGVN